MTKKSRVRVETDGESSRTYDVRRGEEVTVRTKRERPEVTGGGGGGGGGGDFNPLGCLLGIIIILVIIYKAVDYTANLVEVNVIKKIDPTYKTRREISKEEEIKQAKIDELEEKKTADEEIYFKNGRFFQKQQLSNYFDEEKLKNSLKKNGYALYIRSFCALNGSVWVCGELDCKTNTDETYCYLAIVASEDGGNDYKPLKIFKEMGRIGFGGGDYYKMNILFPEKNLGYLSMFGTDGDGHSVVYKTEDGGQNWNIVLNTKNLHFINSRIRGVQRPIQKIRFVAQNVCLVISFQGDGYPELIESNDSGKSWVYKCNKREVTKTYNGGLIWERVKEPK